MKKFISIIALVTMAATAQAGTLYRFLSDYCPGRDSVCLTNTLATIGTNMMTLVVDGGPWSISNGVVIPSNIELIYSRDTRITLVGTNTIVENTTRIRQDWLTNLNVQGGVNVTGPVAVVGDATVTGTVTAAAFEGDGSGLSNVTIIGTIDYQIDGTTNVVPASITSASMANSSVGNAALADGAVTDLKISAGVVGTNALQASGVAAGEYTNVWIRVDADGRISMISNGVAGAGIVTQALASVLTTGNDGSGLSATNIGSLSGSNAVTFKTITASGVGSAIIGNGRGVTNVSGTNLVLNSVGANALESTAVTPGTYTLATIALDADGRATSASSAAGSIMDIRNTTDGSGTAILFGPTGTQTGDSGSIGQMTQVGVFGGYVWNSTAVQQEVYVQIATDSAFTSPITLALIAFKPDGAATDGESFSVTVPKNYYFRVDVVSGNPSYVYWYGTYDF